MVQTLSSQWEVQNVAEGRVGMCEGGYSPVGNHSRHVVSSHQSAKKDTESEVNRPKHSEARILRHEWEIVATPTFVGRAETSSFV